METTEERVEIDWKDCMLKFLKLVGESMNDWKPELWEDYGITKDQARKILKEYEERYRTTR